MKLMLVFMLWAGMSGCAVTYGRLPPDFDNFKRYVFDIDGQEVSFEVPIHGDEGAFTVYQALTSSLVEKEAISMLTIGYDIHRSYEYYPLTYFGFGVSKSKNEGTSCCTAKDILNHEVSVKRKDHLYRTKLVSINGVESVYIEFDDDSGDVGAMYFLPFYREYALFFTIRIDDIIAADKDFVKERFLMLGNTVATLTVNEKKDRFIFERSP